METYFVREKIIRAMRQFFYHRKFHEVISQVLNTALPLEPNLIPFETIWKTRTGDKKLYLPLSPERSIKRMLAQGIGNCFALGKSFRNLEQEGSQHLPEFIMLEWYRKNANYLDIMKEVEHLILFINDYFAHSTEEKNILYHGKKVDIHKEWKTYSLNDLFQSRTRVSLTDLIKDEELFFSFARKRGYSVEGATWAELFDQIYVNEIESELPKEPLFLIDFPARVSPLCQQRKDNPLFAERFELFIAGVEIANGNTENTNGEYVRKTFEKEHERTRMPIDEEFLKSLEQMNGETYAGIGLGVDRLTMLFGNETTIQSIEPAGGDCHL